MKDKFGVQRQTMVNITVMPSVIVCQVVLPTLLDMKAGEGAGLKEKIHDALRVTLDEYFEEKIGETI
jgi:hypothetical protein